MAPITKAQRAAIKRIFDRGLLFEGDKSPQRLAMDAGWRYVAVTDLPPGDLRERMNDAGYHHLWMHGKYTPVYQNADNIVVDYNLGKLLTYRQFRKTVKTGFDCLMVEWRGIWLGIESDGYVHS